MNVRSDRSIAKLSIQNNLENNILRSFIHLFILTVQFLSPYIINHVHCLLNIKF